MGTERKCTIYKHLLSRDLQSSHSLAKVYAFNRNKVVRGVHVIVSQLINKWITQTCYKSISGFRFNMYIGCVCLGFKTQVFKMQRKKDFVLWFHCSASKKVKTKVAKKTPAQQSKAGEFSMEKTKVHAINQREVRSWRRCQAEFGVVGQNRAQTREQSCCYCWRCCCCCLSCSLLLLPSKHESLTGRQNWVSQL